VFEVFSVTAPPGAAIVSAMRLWTLHPKYLDAKGLVALWREALLAQKVLRGETRGYRRHPQLVRFAQTRNPPAALAAFLKPVHREAVRRGYQFVGKKIGRGTFRGKIVETRGQLLYEWKHLKRKLKRRDPKRLRKIGGVEIPEAHPLFRIAAGEAREWEKIR
jgi:Pyrimidine dimer DNA glycosylase